MEISKTGSIEKYQKIFGSVPLLLMILVLVWFILSMLWVPLVSIFQSIFFAEGGFSFSVLPRLFGSKRIIKSLVNTFLISILTVFTVNIVGIFQILVTEYFKIKGAKFLRLAFFTPLIYSSVSLVAGYKFVYSSTGLLTKLLVQIFPSLDPHWFIGFPAVLFVHTFAMTMFHIIFVRNELNRVDYSTIEAAKDLGANDFYILWRVVLPVIRPSILAASLMVFLGALGSFAAPSILGGKDFSMINTMIKTLINIRKPQMAALLALVLGIASFSLLMVFKAIEKRGHYISVSKVSTTFKKTRIENPLVNGIMHFLSYFMFLIYLAPFLLVILFSFTTTKTILTETIPTSFTLENYITVLSNNATRIPLLNSIKLSIIGVLISLFIGTLGSVIIDKWKSRFSVLLELSLFIPWVIPASMIAVGIILSYGDPTPMMFGRTLIGSFIILPLAYGVIRVPFTLRMVRAALYGVDRNLELAARSLGAGSYYTFSKITLPLIMPTLASVAALSFNVMLSEYTLSALLYNFNNKPLGIALRDSATSERSDQIVISLVYVVLLMVFSSITIMISNYFSTKNGGKK